MAHDPSLGFADYFSAADASAAEVATLMEPGMGEQPELFGLHAADMESFLGMRGLAAMPGAAHGHSSKAAVLIDAGQDGGGSATLRFIGEQHQQHHHHQQAPLSLSLCGPDGVGVTLHHQQQHLGDSSRHHHNQQHTAAWMQQQHDYDSPVTSHGQQLHGGGAWHLRGSRFLLPAQQLLHEFCSLPVGATSKQSKAKPPPSSQTQQEEDGGEVSSLAPSTQIQGMDALELQRLKDKLYIMLEEVDRRYSRYSEQMRSVAGGFEAVAGERAAAAYTALASRTISRHFRSLRDGVVAQLQAVRRALGEKDVTAVPGMTRGDTPRLRVLDQCIRQQKALVQGGVMEAHPWRPQRGLPERAVTILRAWLFEHFLHPYPSDVDKHILARQTGLSRMQVSNWFINARVRLWKPMVEEMYVEEMKCDQQPADGGSGGGGGGGQQPGMNSANNPSCSHASEAHGGGGHVVDDDHGDHGDNGGDRKPTRAQLLHNAGSLAAVVNVGGVAHGGGSGAGGGARLENFGVMDHLDFDAYDGGGGGGHHQGGFGGAGGVSLTLGLQQHDDGGGSGVNIAFGAPPPSAHHHHHGGPPPAYLFSAGGHHQQMEGGVHPSHGGHHVQFGATMDDVEAPPHGQAAEHYRTLSAAGFHLLRDLAG